jgi:hypothetical protein
MATKTEQFKARVQRANHNRPPQPKKPKRDRYRLPNPTSHNEAPRAEKTSRYTLELSAGARPSRKSTRKSENRQKTDSQLRITNMNRNSSPGERASRPTKNPI